MQSVTWHRRRRWWGRLRDPSPVGDLAAHPPAVLPDLERLVDLDEREMGDGFGPRWLATRRYFVLTNQRVVVAKGIINKSEESAPLSRIQDARLDRSPLTGGKVKLATAGTGQSLAVDEIGPLTRADALAFSDALTPLIGK